MKALWKWLNDRLGISESISPALLHNVPPDARWWYVFGSATLAAFTLQVASGVALMFVYVPSSGDAYSSLQHLSTDPWGSMLRAMHYFGASAMVLMVGVHAIQVFLFAAYKYPREMNWITGVLLLGFTIGMGFTGQILRWDQTAVWSVVVAAEQAGRMPLVGPWLARALLGGDGIGGETLSRFFALHVFILPGLLVAMIATHLQLILRHGISEPPVPGVLVDKKTYRENYSALLEKRGVPFWPDAAWRDVVFSVGLIIAVLFCAWQFGAPELGKPPDPSLPDANPRPDWYLLWYFAVLALLPPNLEWSVMVFGPPLAALALLLLPLVFPTGERHPSRRPWAVGGVIVLCMSIGVFWQAGVRSNWSPRLDLKTPPPNAQKAEKLFYKKSCIACHQWNGEGGRRGPDLTRVSERLTREQAVIRLLNGGPNMPAYSRILTPAELDALVNFLTQKPTASPTPTPPVAPQTPPPPSAAEF